MKRWLADTLFKRLFILMWVALVASHFAAFMAVHYVVRGDGSNVFDRLPTLPSLPPTAGLADPRLPPPPPSPSDGGRPGPPPPGERAIGGAPMVGGQEPRALDAPPGLSPGAPPGSMPTRALVLDYGIRLLVIGLAAWWGARWLSAPMGRLVAASHTLAGSLGAETALKPLDERRGTVEVREAAHVFNSLAQRLHQFVSSRALMVASISHDLRTPLTRMRMRCELAADDPQSQRSIGDIREMDNLIDSALAVFSSQEASEPPRTTDVFSLVQSLTDDLAELGQPVALSGSQAVATVQPIALRRVVSNLVGNALRYGERAEVAVHQDANEVTIVVDDFGPGIPATHLELVMQPFFRLDASRSRATGGSGLGLFIARDLLSRQGGRLMLANRETGGLRATIVVPKRTTSGRGGEHKEASR